MEEFLLVGCKTGCFKQFDISLQSINFASSYLNKFKFCTTCVKTNQYFVLMFSMFIFSGVGIFD